MRAHVAPRTSTRTGAVHAGGTRGSSVPGGTPHDRQGGAESWVTPRVSESPLGTTSPENWTRPLACMRCKGPRDGPGATDRRRALAVALPVLIFRARLGPRSRRLAPCPCGWAADLRRAAPWTPVPAALAGALSGGPCRVVSVPVTSASTAIGLPRPRLPRCLPSPSCATPLRVRCQPLRAGSDLRSGRRPLSSYPLQWSGLPVLRGSGSCPPGGSSCVLAGGCLVACDEQHKAWEPSIFELFRCPQDVPRTPACRPQFTPVVHRLCTVVSPAVDDAGGPPGRSRHPERPLLRSESLRRRNGVVRP